MELQLKIAGGLLIALAGLHAVFPRYFGWKEGLRRLSLINREIMYVHTLFIALTLLLMGLLCVGSARELTTTPLGRKVALGCGIFWAVRLGVQFFGYSPALWRGKRFETTVHIAFTGLWLYLTWVFLGAYRG